MSTFSRWNGPDCCPPGCEDPMSDIQKLIKELQEAVGALETELSTTNGTLDDHIGQTTLNPPPLHPPLQAALNQAITLLQAYAENSSGGAPGNSALSQAKAYTDSVKTTLQQNLSAEETARIAGDAANNTKINQEITDRGTAINEVKTIIQALHTAFDTLALTVSEIRGPNENFVIKVYNAMDIVSALIRHLEVYYKIDFIQWNHTVPEGTTVVNNDGWAPANNIVVLLGHISDYWKSDVEHDVPSLEDRVKSAQVYVKYTNSKPWNALVDVTATKVADNTWKGSLSAICAKGEDRGPITFGLYKGTTSLGDVHIYLGVRNDESRDLPPIDQVLQLAALRFWLAGINFIPMTYQTMAQLGVYELVTATAVIDQDFAVPAISVDDIHDSKGRNIIKINHENNTFIFGDINYQLTLQSANRPNVIHKDLSRHDIAYLSDLAQSVYWQRAVTSAHETLAEANALRVRIDANGKIISPTDTPPGYQDVPGFYTTDPSANYPSGHIFSADEIVLLKDGGTRNKEVPDGKLNDELPATGTASYLLTQITNVDLDELKVGTVDPMVADGTTVVDVNGVWGKVTSAPSGTPLRVSITRLPGTQDALFEYKVPAYAVFNGTELVKTEDILIPETFDGYIHDISYEWSGEYRVHPSDTFFTETYLTWTAHHENNKTVNYGGDAWDYVDLHLDGYRSAAQQDEIDNALQALASIQPDYAENKASMLFRLPFRSEDETIPNPAHINNRPWTGVAVVDGGTFIEPLQYAGWVVDGGDFTGVAGEVDPRTQKPLIPADNQFRNVIIRQWRGLYADMPEVKEPDVAAHWANFAHTLRWCEDTDDKGGLWYSDGTKLVQFSPASDRLLMKTLYPDGSWEWWHNESDGGGHWFWDNPTGILRFSGPNADNRPASDNPSPIVWEEYEIEGGDTNFVITGGTRIGTRLITAWDSGVRGQGTLRKYYTVGRNNSAYGPEDELITKGPTKSGELTASSAAAVLTLPLSAGLEISITVATNTLAIVSPDGSLTGSFHMTGSAITTTPKDYQGLVIAQPMPQSITLAANTVYDLTIRVEGYPYTIKLAIWYNIQHYVQLIWSIV